LHPRPESLWDVLKRYETKNPRNLLSFRGSFIKSEAVLDGSILLGGGGGVTRIVAKKPHDRLLSLNLVLYVTPKVTPKLAVLI
jgi:hypothetical protein